MSFMVSVLAMSLLLAGSTFAREKKIKHSELPAAVEKTVVERSEGATIRGFNEQKEKRSDHLRSRDARGGSQ
jgi:hypothetical protein